MLSYFKNRRLKEKYICQLMKITLVIILVCGSVHMLTLVNAEEASYVAQIGETKYEIFPDAINNRRTDSSLMLLSDITLTHMTDGDFFDGFGCSLDLNNHKLIGANANSTLRFKNNGEVNIKNGSIITDNTTYCNVIVENAYVNLKNVKLENSTSNGNSLKILQGAILNIRDVSSISNSGGGVEAAGGTANIYNSQFVQNGYYNHNSQNIAVSQGGTVNVYDESVHGTTENYGFYVFNSGGTMNIYGGTFQAGKAVLKADFQTGSSIINVFGGQFDGKIEIAKEAHLNIQGGTFKNTGLDLEAFCHYVVDGYSVIEKDGEYRVYPQTTAIKCDQDAISMEVGKTSTLKTIIAPKESLDTVTYTSSHLDVATVNEKGVINAVSPGTSIITVTAGKQRTKCIVMVYELDQPSKPSGGDSTDKVQIEIDEVSQKMINETVGSLIFDIINDKQIDETVIDQLTVNAIKKAISEGKSVVPKIKIGTIKAEDVKKINELVKTLSNYDKQSAILQYLDLNIEVVADEQVLGMIHYFDQKISFTISVPTDQIKKDRDYYVIRVHNGKAEKLEMKMIDDGVFSFQTDVFSAYALVYEESVLNHSTSMDSVDEPIEVVRKPEQVTNTKISQSVQTSDESSTDLYASFVGLGLSTFIILIAKKKYMK